jgi:hypothetical protein
LFQSFKTGRREVTDGQTGGDKPPIKIETREITDGQTGGDKHTIKRTETTVFLLEGLPPPIIQSLFPLVSVFLLVGLSPPV